MSILAALARAYDRLPKVPMPGYSTEKIGLVIGLNPDGTVASVTDQRDGEGKKKQPRMMQVPQPVKRTVAVLPNLLWDKTSYALGVTAGGGKRTAEEHEAFKRRQAELIGDTEDEGLGAFLRFLERWTPDQFAPPYFAEDMKDTNVVFALESERRQTHLHDRVAAQALIAATQPTGGNGAMCLVTGRRGPVARLHPSIKNVWGAQSAGASIVSFNLDAFTSYGHAQGDNAPVSELAAFKYTTALNSFLADSRHRLQIGDASTVFWADAREATARDAEDTFAAMFNVVDETQQSQRVGEVLARIRSGQPWLAAAGDLMPDLAEGVRFFVLGLAPNAARLSIRFWFEDDFGVLAENYRHFVEDMRIEPAPRSDRTPTLRRMLLRTAPAQREQNGRIKFDQDRVPPLLAGEFFRSILTGDRYPGMLLGQLLQRVRSDGLLDHLRISLIKATIARAMRFDGRLPLEAQGKTKEDYLVRSDPNDPNDARRLGRLFALIERAQRAALGDEINSTVTDKYLGTCAATPQQVIPKLVLDAQEHHLKRLRNGHSDARWIVDAAHAKRVGAGLNRDIGQLFGSFENGLPSQHSNEEQGLFLVGYYQERYGRLTAEADEARPPDADETAADLSEE